jgi:uncharacterized protein YcbX
MNPIGTIASLRRYPVKSMQGEVLTEATFTERGLLGDRTYAIQDQETGYIASAKLPRKWRTLYACRAAFSSPPQPDQPLPPITITLPDGTSISSDQPDVHTILSRVLDRGVRLISIAPDEPTREADRRPVDDEQELLRVERMAGASPSGTFFDHAPVHVLTTATLAELQRLQPDAQFDVRRFRPNLLITPASDAQGFVENAWLGSHLRNESGIRWHLIDPSPRCVVPTLAVDELPSDPRILRTITQHNTVASVTAAPSYPMAAVAGAYAVVINGGMIRVGDSLWLE